MRESDGVGVTDFVAVTDGVAVNDCVGVFDGVSSGAGTCRIYVINACVSVVGNVELLEILIQYSVLPFTVFCCQSIGVCQVTIPGVVVSNRDIPGSVSIRFTASVQVNPFQYCQETPPTKLPGTPTLISAALKVFV